MSDTNDQTETPQPPRRRKRRRGKNQSTKPITKSTESLDESPLGNLRRLFIGCPRCSYFLTGYQAYEGLNHLEEVAQQEGDSLALHWNAGVKHLIDKAFGGSVDHGGIFYSVFCPECHRVYQFDGREEDNPLLSVQIMPR